MKYTSDFSITSPNPPRRQEAALKLLRVSLISHLLPPAARRISMPRASARFIYRERFANTFRYARPFYWCSVRYLRDRNFFLENLET